MGADALRIADWSVEGHQTSASCFVVIGSHKVFQSAASGSREPDAALAVYQMKKIYDFSLRSCAIFFCLWFWCATSQAQTNNPASPAPAIRKPLTIASLPKLAPVKLKDAEGKEIELHGQLAFAVTQANEDDTLTGWMLYLLPDEQRERLAKHSGQPLKNIPPYLMKTEVAGTWVKGASCPFLRMESGAVEFEILGGKIHFTSVALEFKETPDYLPQLFCHWTRQLNARKQRRSIIAAINRALKGEEPE